MFGVGGMLDVGARVCVCVLDCARGAWRRAGAGATVVWLGTRFSCFLFLSFSSYQNLCFKLPLVKNVLQFWDGCIYNDATFIDAP